MGWDRLASPAERWWTQPEVSELFPRVTPQSISRYHAFMKFLIASFLLTAVIARGAEPVSSIMGADETQIDPKKVEDFIAWVEPSIREYPPRFKDDDEEQSLQYCALLVMGEIKKLDPKTIKDAAVLTNLAHILSMGNNLDFPTGAQAKTFFEHALSLDPNSKRANYLFGMFLIATDKFHLESLPYLQKAFSLGEKDAQYSVGLLFCEMGNKTQGLQDLEAYSKANPENEKAKQVIQSIKDGTLTFEHINGG